jgi:hypothetical protein
VSNTDADTAAADEETLGGEYRVSVGVIVIIAIIATTTALAFACFTFTVAIIIREEVIIVAFSAEYSVLGAALLLLLLLLLPLPLPLPPALARHGDGTRAFSEPPLSQHDTRLCPTAVCIAVGVRATVGSSSEFAFYSVLYGHLVNRNERVVVEVDGHVAKLPLLCTETYSGTSNGVCGVWHKGRLRSTLHVNLCGTKMHGACVSHCRRERMLNV